MSFPKDPTGELLELMQGEGIDLSLPYMLDFYVLFNDEQQGRLAADRIAKDCRFVAVVRRAVGHRLPVGQIAPLARFAAAPGEGCLRSRIGVVDVDPLFQADEVPFRIAL